MLEFMQKKDPTKQIWFTRRDKQVRGPFPAGMITRHILLGRIVMDDELSLDQCNWHRVSEVPELIPEERLLDLSVPHNQRRLQEAIIRADERNAGDRRGNADSPGQQFQRREGDRRAPESEMTLMHRTISTNLAKSLQPEKDKYRAGYFIILLLIAMVLGLSLTLSKRSPAPVINVACSSIPAPSVNWSNCHKQNKDLHDVNLASANLSYGTFEGSNFTNATLLGANLEHSDLSEIIAFKANLQSARLTHSVLKSANLSNANLSYADLRYAVLINADLRGADFTGADLTQAVLNKANIEGAVFEGAVLEKTIWINNSVCQPESLGSCVEVDSGNPPSSGLTAPAPETMSAPQPLADPAAQAVAGQTAPAPGQPAEQTTQQSAQQPAQQPAQQALSGTAGAATTAVPSDATPSLATTPVKTPADSTAVTPKAATAAQ